MRFVKVIVSLLRVARATVMIPFSSFYWMKALDLASHNKFQDALIMIDKSIKLVSHKNSMILKWVEPLLLKGYLLLMNEDFPKCVKIMEASISILQEQFIGLKSEYNLAEQNYLLFYAYFYLSSAKKNLGQEDEAEKAVARINFSLSPLSQIRPSLLKNFPMYFHPEWENKCCPVQVSSGRKP